MTDRTDHRAEAERMLDEAYDWGRQTGEMPALAFAAVHALFAIHDTLTAADPTPNPLTETHPWPPWTETPPDADAADRYAANEAKQREAGEPKPTHTVRYRDAITGEYITAEEAAERPATTVRETRRI